MRALLVIFASLLLSTADFAQVKATAEITVEVDGKSAVVKLADLAKLPRKEITAKDHDGKDTTYSGIELRSILEPRGAKFGKELRGPAIAQFLVVSAADGYHAVFSLTELDTDFADKTVILADRDGRPLDEKNSPWQIIATAEKKHARWVRQVVTLKVSIAK